MIVAIFLYILLTTLVFAPALFAPGSQLIFGDDIRLTYYFFREFISQSFHQGIVPLWNPYLFSGQPFLGHPQAFLPFYPPHWLFVVFPVNRAFSIFLALHVALGMVGMFWMMRRWVGFLPSWISGVVFGLSGFFIARVWAGHTDVIAAASWVPWVFGAFYQAMQNGNKRFIVLGGALLAIELLAGYQSVAVFTMEVVGIAALFLCLQKKSVRPFGVILIATAIGLGFSAIQLLPEQEFARLSIRSFPLPYEWTSAFSLNSRLMKLLVDPFAFGNQRNFYGQWPNLGEYLMFIGRIPLGLAIFQALCATLFLLASSRSRPQSVYKGYFAKAMTMLEKVRRTAPFRISLLFLCIAIFSIWISFGPNAPIDLLKIAWTIFPPYHVFRLPSRHLILFVFAASALVGFSFDLIKRRLLQVILSALILIELFPFAEGFIETKPIPESHHDPELVTFLKADTSLYRIYPNFGVWLSPRESLDFDSSMTYKIFSVTGYDPSIVRNYYEFIDAANGKTTSSILEHNVQIPYLDVFDPFINFLNIKYVYVPTWADPFIGKGTEQFVLVISNEAKGFRLYENRAVMPRFFFVQKARVFTDREAERAAVIEKELDFTKTVFLNTPGVPQGDCEGSGIIELQSYTPNKIVLTTRNSCSEYLVSSEVYFPGWEAFIDGKKAQLYEANLAFRTLFVPGGNHTVEMVYVPKTAYVGGLISLGTLIVSLFLL